MFFGAETDNFSGMSVISPVATPDPLARFFDDLEIAHTTHAHDAVFTVAEGGAVKQALAGGHTRNLFLKDKNGRLWLVVALEDTPVDLKALPATIGSGRLSFGKPDLMHEVLGVTPGSVTPFSLINDTQRRVTPVLDAAMMACAQLNFHPLINTMTTTIASADLTRLLQHLGYDPLVVDFNALGATSLNEEKKRSMT